MTTANNLHDFGCNTFVRYRAKTSKNSATCTSSLSFALSTTCVGLASSGSPINAITGACTIYANNVALIEDSV